MGPSYKDDSKQLLLLGPQMTNLKLKLMTKNVEQESVSY